VSAVGVGRRLPTLSRPVAFLAVVCITAVSVLSFQGSAFALTTPAMTDPIELTLPSGSILGTAETTTTAVAAVSESVVPEAGLAAEAAGGAPLFIAAAPEVAVAAVGVAAIYSSWKLGTMISNSLDSSSGNEVNNAGPSGVPFRASSYYGTQGISGSDPHIWLSITSPAFQSDRFGYTHFSDVGPIFKDASGTLTAQCETASGYKFVFQLPSVFVSTSGYDTDGIKGLGFLAYGSHSTIGLSDTLVGASDTSHGACVSIPYAVFRPDTTDAWTSSSAWSSFNDDRALIWSNGEGANVYWWQECQATDGTLTAASGFLSHPAAAGEDLTFPACASGTHRVEGEFLSGSKLLAHFKLPPAFTDTGTANSTGLAFIGTGSTPLPVGTDSTACTYGTGSATSTDCGAAYTITHPTCTTGCGEPGADPVPAGGASDSCFPSGWGLFNPVEWVEKPIKCALIWAFVPDTATWGGDISTITTSLSTAGPGPWFTAMGTVLGGLGGTAGGCAGPTVNFDLGSVHQVLHPFSACDPPMSVVAGIAYAFTTVSVVVLGGLAIIRALSVAFGFNFSFGRRATAEGD
jgi:hypothetical protein